MKSPEEMAQIFKDEEIGKEITCPKAFDLATKYGISKMEIAKYCNMNQIKIRACQLGCFK